MKYSIKLHNNTRTFTTLSNLSELEIQNGKFKRVILLLHGFPDNNTTYVDLCAYLSKKLPQGTLFISPSMRGYEPSSQGDPSEYRISDLGKDIRAWITQIVPEETRSKIPVHLVGHDWGAIAVFRASADYPDLITSSSTLAIPYLSNIKPWEFLFYAPQQIYYSSYMFTMQFSWLYKSRLSSNHPSDSYLDRLWKFWSPTWDIKRSDIESVKNTFLVEGVIESATAYYRCLTKLSNYLDLKYTVDFDKVPTLILGGAEDGCMISSLYELEKKKFQNVPNVKVQLLPNLGHFLQREDPEKVAEVIGEWILLHDK